MLSFKVNPVYTSLSILIKLRKDVPETEFSIQVLNETEKFPFCFHYVLNKNFEFAGFAPKTKKTRFGPFPWKRSVLQNPD